MQSITFVALTVLAASSVNAGTMKTIAPSPEPTNAPITAAPTPCGNRLFYIITIDGITKCSNGYDAEADSLDYFDSSADCCAYLTNESMLDADDYCRVIDVCNPTEAPTDSPTPAPFEEIITPEPTPSPVTDEPTVKPTCAPTTCEGRKYYIITDIDGVEKCSNGMDYTDDEMMDSDSAYDTIGDCCAELIATTGDGDADAVCKYIDICNPTDEPTPSPTPAPIEAIVTPAPVTPAPIETPSPVTPAPTPCEGRKWYLTTSEGDGTTTTCTNGYDITSMGDGATIFYDTFLECCEAEAMETMDNTDCKYIDVCNPPAPTPAPVENVTFEPTVGSSIGSTPTVGKEMESGYINLGPRK